MLFLILSILSSTAMAGKLSEGFRGLPYGPATVLDVAPVENSCVRMSTTDNSWICKMALGEAFVTVHYYSQYGMFYATAIKAEGISNSFALFDILIAGYGKGSPGTNCTTVVPTPTCDRWWRDGNVKGTWDYNQYSKEATFYSYERTLSDKVEALDKEKAKSASSGL